MRINQLLAVVIVVTQCGTTVDGIRGKEFSSNQDVQKIENDKLTKSKTKSRHRVKFPRHGLSLDITKTTMKDLISSKEMKIKQRMIMTKPSENEQNVNRSISKVYYEQGNGKTLSQGDIEPTERLGKQIVDDVISRPRTKRQVLRDKNLNSTWSDGVFYTFNTSDQDVRKAFKMGVKVWTEATCVDFIEDRNALDKVIVMKGDECSSAVGRLGGAQHLQLNRAGATEGTAVHEIGHVLGFFHTMVRYDRRRYIDIIEKNLDPLAITNFVKVSGNYADVFGLTYDYGSIMHYAEISGSINGLPTMIAKEPNYQKTMGSAIISFSDIYMINEHYGCNARCKNMSSAKCENEGYPHPRNCSICICPSGYGGALCDRRPRGCGENLVATNKKRTLVYRLGFGSALRDQFNFCNYMISAPKGKKIVVDVQSISHGYDEPGCRKGGVEIKAQKDQKRTGYRFCSPRGTGSPIVSSSNPLPVILFNRFAVMQIILTYHYTD